VVVEIFNLVNSGGTKLSEGDLALAKICAEWPEARDEMKCRLEKWRRAGFQFKLDWLLRTIYAVLTGEALFSALKDVDTATFRQGLLRSEKAVDYLLNFIASRLGLDHDLVLGSRYWPATWNSAAASWPTPASATGCCTGTCTPSSGVTTRARPSRCSTRTWPPSSSPTGRWTG
jgi:hypothetical protein